MRKMKRTIISILPLMFVFLMHGGCDPNAVDDTWLIPEDEIYDGGPGKDGIPALSSPSFVSVDDATNGYLKPDDLILGIRIGDIVRGYPHPILDWHEIINDRVTGIDIVVSYCPLTGSGLNWEALPDAEDKTFGVSGLLYNSNLILYDRESDSNWSQMLMLCVNGEYIGTEPEVLAIIETSWRTWQEAFPRSEVVSVITGYNRDYGTYPYGDYKTGEGLLFPVSTEDNRLPNKERVHGIIVGESTTVFPIKSLGNGVQVINHAFSGLELVVAGSSDKNFCVSYERTLDDGTLLTFSPVDGELPVIMRDASGSRWDMFGRALDGPMAGKQLNVTLSYNAYWFAWAAFYPGADIYQAL